MTDKPEYITDVSELMGWNEPKKIITEISGWVPIFDCVLQDNNNLTKTAIHGAMWRFCQMKDNACRASLATIGKMIGVDKATVMRYAKELCDEGYFVDLTPDLKNRPHIYADTGKVRMRSKFDVAQDNTGVAQCNATVAQSQLSKVLNKDINTLSERKEKAKERIEDQRAKRKDPVDWVLGNAEKEGAITSMQERTSKALGLDVSGSRFDKMVSFLMQKDRQGETIEVYAAWMKADPYNSPKTHQIAQRPDIVRETWAAAFVNKEPSFDEALEKAGYK